MIEKDKIDKAYDELVELGVNKDVISYACSVEGYNMHTMESVLYWATGYNNFKQLNEEEEE